MNTPSLKEGMHVVILGAGISGLSLAWFLKRKWGSKIRISIVEKEKRAGGWIETDTSQGFLFEKGPRSFRTKGSGLSTLRLIRDLGLKDQVIVPKKTAADRYLYFDGFLHKVSLNPFSPFFLGTFSGLVKDWLTPKSEEADESIAAFFRRRTGSFVTNRLVDPMITGIYAGNIENLSIRSCLPKIWEWEQNSGSLIKGLWSQKKKKIKDPWLAEMQKHPLFSLKNGAGSLCKALESELKGSLWLNTIVKSIKIDGEQLLVSTPQMTFRADYVYSTLPAHSFSGLTESPYLDNLLKCIPMASIAIVNMGYKRLVNEYEGFGYLIPSDQKEKALGVVWDSSVFPQQNTYDPETRVTVMLGGSQQPEIIRLPPEEIYRLALNSLSKQMNILFKPDAFKVTLANQAIPQYRVGHHVLMGEIEKAVESFSPRLRLLGSSFYGVAVNDCIAHAEAEV